MKYYEVKFDITPYTEDFCDVLSAMIADAGFETFVPETNGMKAYCQRDLFDKEAVDEAIAQFPIPNIKITYAIEEAEDKDWNAEWEKGGYEPIAIDHRLAVHAPGTGSPCTTDLDLTIRPCQAFGTGTHPTTRTLLETLLEMDLHDKKVIDAGCGTGILGILCSKLGAKEIVAYDIDEWSVRNTQENAESNAIYNIDVREGDSSVIVCEKEVDLLIANIFREIIINDMPRFVETLSQSGKMLFSGFYLDDVPLIEAASQKYGFHIEKQIECENWAVLIMSR